MTDSIKVCVYSVLIKSAGWLSGQASSSLEPEHNCVLPQTPPIKAIPPCLLAASSKATAVLQTSVCVPGLQYMFTAYALNICSELRPNERTSGTSGFRALRLRPTLSAACSLLAITSFSVFSRSPRFIVAHHQFSTSALSHFRPGEIIKVLFYHLL